MFLVFQVDFLFPKFEKNFPNFQIKKKKDKMLPITKKRVRLSIDEKIWILNHRKENPKITQNKIALYIHFNIYLINTGCLFFRNPPLPQISTFSSGQKGCAYYEESAYLGCAYYESAQYSHSMMFLYIFRNLRLKTS